MTVLNSNIINDKNNSEAIVKEEMTMTTDREMTCAFVSVQIDK